MKMIDPSLGMPKFHGFGYGYGGSGKSKFAADMHKAGLKIAVVTNEQRWLTYYSQLGMIPPIIVPTDGDEIRAVIAMPEAVIEKVIQPLEAADGSFPYSDYVPQAWIFDNVRSLQRVIFGDRARMEKKEIFNGAIELESQRATGIMSQPAKRGDAGTACQLDYKVLDDETRAVLAGVEAMKYHTWVTAHAEKSLDQETRLKMTGDPSTDKKVNRVYSGFPSLMGWSAKNEVPSIVGDFFIYFDTHHQEQFTMWPKPTGDWYARTSVAEKMARQYDWTNKNGFELLMKEGGLK